MRDQPASVEWSLERIANALERQNELLANFGTLIERASTPILTAQPEGLPQ